MDSQNRATDVSNVATPTSTQKIRERSPLKLLSPPLLQRTGIWHCYVAAASTYELQAGLGISDTFLRLVILVSKPPALKYIPRVP